MELPVLPPASTTVLRYVSLANAAVQRVRVHLQGQAKHPVAPLLEEQEKERADRS